MSNARGWGALDLMRLSATTTTTQGSAVDLATYASDVNREMKAVFVISGISAQTAAFTAAITECDTTNGTFVAPTYGTTQVTGITTNGVSEMNFFADKRYIRAEVTFGPNVTSANVTAVGFALKRIADS